MTKNLISYDGSPWMFTVNILRFREERIAQEALYVMEGFDAADWRREWATMFYPLAAVSPQDWQEGAPYGIG